MITCIWLQWLAGRDRLRDAGELHRQRETETCVRDCLAEREKLEKARICKDCEFVELCRCGNLYFMFSLLNKVTRVSERQPCPLPSSPRSWAVSHWCRNPGRKKESRCRHVVPVEFAVCGRHPFARGPPPGAPSSAAGHEGGPGTSFPDPRPDAAGGPRAVPELDGPGGSGRGSNTGSGPAHPHAAEQDGSAGWSGGFHWPLWEDRRGMWVASSELARAPHSTAVGGGPVGGAAVANSEPPGLQRPQKSHPPAGRLEPRTTSSALPIAGAGGKQPALRDGSTAPGRVTQMAVGWGRRCRPDSGSGGAGAVHRAAPQEDRAVGPVPPADIVGPGHSTGGGPDGSMPWGWRGPSSGLSLSLSLSLPSVPNLSLSLGHGWILLLEPHPAGGVGRHRSPEAWGPCPGGRGLLDRLVSPILVPRSLLAKTLTRFPPLERRGSLGRPVGVAGTQGILSIGARWWR